MKLTAKAGVLLAAINKVKSAVSSRTVIPILQCVRIATEGSRATVTATNTQMWLSSEMDIASESDIAWCIPAERLAGVLASWQADATVYLSDEEGPGRIKVECGRSRILFDTAPAADFPIVAAPKDAASFTIETSEITRIFRAVSPSIDDTATRPALSGIHLWPAEGAILVTGANPQRVSRVSCAVTGGTLSQNIIIPREVIAAARSLRGTVEVTASDRLLSITAGDDHVVTRLLDIEGFDFARVIAPKITAPAVVHSEQLAEVAARCLAVADPAKTGRRAGGVILRLDIGPSAIPVSDEFGAFTDGIECLSQAEEAKVALSARHLLDAAETLTDGLIEIHSSNNGLSTRLCRPGDEVESITLAGFRV